MKTALFLVALLAGLLLVPHANGQTLGGLLQKGIYTQETLGDVDAAIQIYRQILATKSESRADLAQALFRLGQCLLQKHDEAGAARSFQQLVQDYPEQKALVARAKEYLPGEFKLLPSPWADDELAEYHIKLPGGQQIGMMYLSVEASLGNPQHQFLDSRFYQTGLPLQIGHAEVDRETLRPVAGSFLHRLLKLDSRATYDAGQARVEVKGQEAKTVHLDGLVFDNEEAMFLFRRLPLSPVFKSKIPVISPLGVLVKFDANVVAVEDVRVEAGSFRCYKIDTGMLQQTFWVGVDAPHPLVKLDLSGAMVELAHVGKIDRVTPVEFHDTRSGLSLTASPGWVVSNNELAPPEQRAFWLLDPKGQAYIAIEIKAAETPAAQIGDKLRTGFDAALKLRGGQLKNYQPRAGSLQTRLVGNQQALTAVSDYMDGTTPLVEYLTAIRSEASDALVTVRLAPEDLPAFQQRFEPILSAIRLK